MEKEPLQEFHAATLELFDIDKDYDVFKEKMSDPDKAQKVYDAFQKAAPDQGYEPLPEYDVFVNDMGLSFEKKKPEISSPDSGLGSETVSEVTQTEQPDLGDPFKIAGTTKVAVGTQEIEVPNLKPEDAKAVEESSKKLKYDQFRSERFGDVARGLAVLADSQGQPADKYFKQIAPIMENEDLPIEQRDILALKEVDKIYQNAGVKRSAISSNASATNRPEDILDPSSQMARLYQITGEVEEKYRKKDPVAWDRFMKDEMASDMQEKRIDDPVGYQLSRTLQGPMNLTGLREAGGLATEDVDTPEFEEAQTRLLIRDQENGIKQFADHFGVDLNDIEGATDKNAVVQIKAMQSNLDKLQASAQGIRDQRHSKVLESMNATKQMLLKPGLSDFHRKEINAIYDALEKQHIGFIKPELGIKEISTTYSDEINIASPDVTKSPMERIRETYAALAYEEDRLSDRLALNTDASTFASEQIARTVPLTGQGHTEDELRHYKVSKMLKAMAPVALLNDNPDLEKEYSAESLMRSFTTVLGGEGGMIMGSIPLTSPQARASDIDEAIILSGLDPNKVMSAPMRSKMDVAKKGYGLGDLQFWAELSGTVSALGVLMAPTSTGMNATGLPAMLTRMGTRVKGAQKAFVAKSMLNAMNRGIQFELTGLATPNQAEEMNFASGLLGGFGEQVGASIIKKGAGAVAALFGVDTPKALSLISDHGAKLKAADFVSQRASMGLGEFFGEGVESIVHAWQQTGEYQTFMEGLESEFGTTFDDKVKFFVSTFAMGMFMPGGTNERSISNVLLDRARIQYESATPEQQAQIDDLTDDLRVSVEEAHDEVLPEITEEREIEDTPIPESEEVVIEEVEDTPEITAAKAEIERRKEVDKTIGSTFEATGHSGTGSRNAAGMTEEEFTRFRIREELTKLNELESRQELTENEKKKKANLETVVEGLNQMEAAPKVEVEPTSIDDVQSFATSNGIFLDLQGVNDIQNYEMPENLYDAETGKEIPRDDKRWDAFEDQFDNYVNSPEVVVTPETAQDATAADLGIEITDEMAALIEQLSPQEVADEILQSSEPIVTSEEVAEAVDTPKTRDQVIADQIDEFFSNLAGTIGENASKKIQEYAQRIVDGADRDSTIEGLPSEWVKGIDQGIDAIKGEQKATKKKKTKKRAKPVANKERKTKNKPAKELNSSEIVTEALANNTEPESPQTQARNTEIETEVENAANEVSGPIAETKKDRPRRKVAGQSQELEKGVEDQFLEVRANGRKTLWRKKNNKWQFRNYKPGTRTRENQFNSNWQNITSPKDIARTEKLSQMDELALDTANAAKQWIAAWGDVVTLRFMTQAPSGKLFSKVDLGATEAMVKILESSAKLGVAVARQMAAKGEVTREAWAEKMKSLVGEHISPILDRTWRSTQEIMNPTETAVAEDAPKPKSKKAKAKAKAQKSKAKEKKEKQKSKEKGKSEPSRSNKNSMRGAYKTMSKYANKNSKTVNSLLSKMDKTYQRVSNAKQLQDGLQFIEENGGMIEAYEAVRSNKGFTSIESLPYITAARITMIEFYSRLADSISYQAGNEKNAAKKKELETASNAASVRAENMIKAFTEAGTDLGRAISVMGEYRNIVGYLPTTLTKMISEFNTEAFANDPQLAKDFTDIKREIEKSRQDQVMDVATSQSVSTAIDNVADGNVKPSKKRLAKIRKKRSELKEDLKNIINRGTDNMLLDATSALGMLADRTSEASIVIGKIGLTYVETGTIKFSEWASKMRAILSALGKVDDALLRDIFDNQEVNGTTSAAEAKKKLDKASKKAESKPRSTDRKTLRAKVRGAINDHVRDTNPDKVSLEQRLVDDAGLDYEEASYIADTVRDEVDTRVRKRIEAKANKLKRKSDIIRTRPKGDIQKAIEAMVDGELTDDLLQEIFQDRMGLMRQISPDEMNRARELGTALDNAPDGRLTERAAMELDRFVHTLIPKPTWFKRQTELWKAMWYFSALSGIITHVKNTLGNLSQTLISGLIEEFTNPTLWVKASRAAIKSPGNKALAFFNASPLSSLIGNLSAIAVSLPNAIRKFNDIMSAGTIDSKYIETQNAKLGRMLGLLEQEKSKLAVPFRAVGRLLAAQDAFFFAINNEMELMSEIRWDEIEKGNPAAIKASINAMKASGPLWDKAMAQAEKEVKPIADVMGSSAKDRKRLTQIRAKELMPEIAGLEEERIFNAENVARSRIFTFKRNGIWGRMATIMSMVNAKTGFTYLFTPFANVAGNMGETYMDYIPGYGMLRSIGLSPTGIAQMIWPDKIKASAKMGDDSIKDIFNFKKDKSQLYYEQMGRAWLGNILLAAAMTAYDDDDFSIQFTDDTDLQHPNYLIINGTPITAYSNIPALAPVASIISQSKAYKKLHGDDDRSFWERVEYAVLASAQGSSNFSVAESSNLLLELASESLGMFTAAAPTEEAKTTMSKLEAALTKISERTISSVFKPLPQRWSIIEQSNKLLFDTKAYSKRDILESVKYSFMGVTYPTTSTSVAQVDIFGNVVDRVPGQDVYGFMEYFKKDIANDELWRFLNDHGGAALVGSPKNTKLNFENDEFDEESSERYTAEKMTPKQWEVFAKESGKEFKNLLQDYYDDPGQWKEDEKTSRYDKTRKREITDFQRKISKMKIQSRKEAKSTMNDMPESKGGFGGKLVGY